MANLMTEYERKQNAKFTNESEDDEDDEEKLTEGKEDF